MDGVLNILKPRNMTSHDVVACVRRKIGIKKIGHTGTLDPDAVGVLPLCIGKATKIVDYLISSKKTYRVEIMLGVITDSGDSSGNVISTSEVPHFKDNEDFKQTFTDVLSSFLGKSKQIPPMHSAIKIDGKVLYKLAHKGITIDRPSRDIEIYEINVINSSLENNTVLFDVTCSKGTYIRVLCEDIGNRIGCGAHMSFLIRTKCSGLDIKNAITLEDLDYLIENNQLEQRLIKIEEALKDYKSITLNKEDDVKIFVNGAKLYTTEKYSENVIYKVFNNSEFLGLGKAIYQDSLQYLKAVKLFV